LSALGYTDLPAQESADAVRQCRSQNTMNLAQAYLVQGRPADALPLLEQLERESSGSTDVGLHLAQCYYELRRMDDCRRVAAALLAWNPDAAPARMIEANLCLAERDNAGALERLLATEKSSADEEPVLCLIGRVYLTLERWPEAERAYRRLLELDPEDPQAHTGLAQALLQLGQWEPAAVAAADALSLRFDLPEAHFALGAALAHLGKIDRAVAAFQACLKLRPELAAARDWLARLQPQYAAAP
jgi:tetratricopeptide (TPR) repeat protein